MAYSFQTFSVGEVLTAAKQNQIEVNIRDHIHGKDSVTSTTRTLSPEAAGTYDLGTSALPYANIFANKFSGAEKTVALRQFDDFLEFGVSSRGQTSGPTSLNTTMARQWTVNISSTANASGINFNPGSRGYVVYDLRNGPHNVMLLRRLRATIADYASLEMDAVIETPIDANTGTNIYAGLVDPSSFLEGNQLGSWANIAAWISIASAAYAPENRAGGTKTTGNSLAIGQGSIARLGVTLSSGQAKYFINGSLWQTLTTNITSTALTSGIAFWAPIGAGTDKTMKVYESMFAVNSV